jgi:phosphatidylethanolamine/phosphatidyl-N-methylethanolamine N-methyltransferase
MGSRWSECRLFFQEFLRNFHTTGAVLPSGRFLAAALARFVAASSGGSRKILEVGPGTGAVTGHIIAAMSPNDYLDLVELNEAFVRKLEHRFQTEPHFQAVASRVRVLHTPVEQLPADQRYDVIVSGLPLNNFSVASVEDILATLTGLLTDGGMLSFFEYIAVRPARAIVSGRADRQRLQGIGRAMRSVLDKHEIRRDAVLWNVPPAWVHHVRKQAALAEK